MVHQRPVSGKKSNLNPTTGYSTNYLYENELVCKKITPIITFQGAFQEDRGVSTVKLMTPWMWTYVAAIRHHYAVMETNVCVLLALCLNLI